MFDEKTKTPTSGETSRKCQKMSFLVFSVSTHLESVSMELKLSEPEGPRRPSRHRLRRPT